MLQRNLLTIRECVILSTSSQTSRRNKWLAPKKLVFYVGRKGSSLVRNSIAMSQEYSLRHLKKYFDREKF